MDKKKLLFNVAWSGKENLLRKGIPELLQAVRHLKDQKFNAQLIMAGEPGDGLELIFQMIKDLQLEEDVKYLGKLSRADKINLLRTCEVYVQPSHYEGFGVAIAEAMACGACIITCDVGGVRDVVGDCGIYVSPNSPKELAEAIRLALCDDELRGQLQNSAHRRIRDHFTSKRKIDILKEYLLEIGIS
jgi:glycosyltransferase involved in cell wall biosynthesis